VKGTKTPSERFAGAVETFTIEAMTQNGWALQAGTSHYLGQNFARAFDVTFQNKEGVREHVYATSWGVSTRLIGALVLAHSDDAGLVLPPRVAPVQVVIVPIYRKGDEREGVMAHAAKVLEAARAAGVRVRLDDRDQMTPGAKYFEWERRGVPLRLEVGPKDQQKGAAMAVRRDDRAKQSLPLAGLATELPALLARIQSDLLARARAFRDAHTREAKSLDDLATRLDSEPGWYLAGWDGDAATEAAVKERTNATIRCLPWGASDPAGRRDLVSGRPAAHSVLFARAY
jgi:prolyl-tRNA synthetase